ncbi:amidohydrolase family protein [Actinomadura atramentaria]|uniref:amidohydrolase family protein n=1 Tax=Actinomadura atramentaria TaxID=1990 RepID=UPI00035D0A24|nr:amidohydrolase family protein [Actinomadura atramentaria]
MSADWLTRTADEHIALDVDVLFGPWPSGPADLGLDDVRRRLRRSAIRRACAVSTRGALFDAAAGNAETLRAADETLVPVGTVDLRDAVAAGDLLDGLVEQGVRFVRLFTQEQGAEPGHPGHRHVVAEAVARGLVLLHDGDPRAFGPVLAGRGAEVVFLDLHVYLLADFLLLARDEPGFRATTRLLSAPDAIERVAGTVGADRLLFGSRTPFMDVSPQTLRLRYARITPDERRLIAGGTAARLLGREG